MKTQALKNYRTAIGRELRELRQERRWTQAELAGRLGVSQGWLSRIEKGEASLSAEQLLYAARIFNASVDRFLPKKRGPAASQIQNALARLGAVHLVETEDVLPSEHLSEAVNVILEVLSAPESPRHVSGIAPVLVEQIPHLDLRRLRARLAEAGLARRLGWLLDNAKQAIEEELESPEALSRSTRVKYNRALSYLSLPHVSPPPETPEEEIFDPGIASEQTLVEVRKQQSAISRKWGMLTFLQPEDFRAALRQVYGPD